MIRTRRPALSPVGLWWYDVLQSMLQTRSPRLTVSHDLYLAILGQNPDLRIERTRDGELIVMPPAGGEASSKNSKITGQLERWLTAGGSGIAFDSSGGFRLPNGATREPDASWIESSRWEALTPDDRRGFPPLCPDFVIELLSAPRELGETREKMDEYIENGARLGWLIDPFRKVIEIYRAGRDPERREHPASVDGEDVLCGFVLDLEVIFAD